MGTPSQRDALENSGEDEQQNRVSGSGKERECYQHTSELLQGCEWASVAKCYGEEGKLLALSKSVFLSVSEE